MKKISWLAALTSLLLTACASGPSIVANTNPGTDFSTFKTFNYMQPLGTDRSNGVRTPFSTRLMASMDREMAARGLQKSDSPDILIDFNIFAEDRIDVRQTPTSTVHHSHWHRGWSTWPTYQTTVRQYTEGSLVIDIVYPAGSMLIAEGSATQRVNNDTLTQEASDQFVNQIMASLWAQ